MVMWDLRRYVVKDVSLRNSVCEDATEPAEKRTGTTEKRAVEGGERTTLEVECRAAIVREVGVGVLEEGDQNQPVVDPEVRNTIDAGHLQEPTGDRPVDKSTNPEEDTYVTDDDLVVLVDSENDRRRPEVVGHLGVVVLARSIHEKVHRPSAGLLGGTVNPQFHLPHRCKPTNWRALVMAAVIGESPSASHISAMTSFETYSPVMSSRAGSKGGKLRFERVFGTKTWS